MNRAERRAAAHRNGVKRTPFQKLSHDGKIQFLEKNGITVEALKENYYRWYTAGQQEGLRISYAAMALALHDTFGFGEQRIIRTLQAVDSNVISQITSDDAVEEVFKRFGFHIKFEDGIESVQPIDE